MSQYHLGILIVKGNLMPVGSGPTRERLPKGLLQLGFHTAPKKQSDLPKKRVWCLMFMKSYLMATPTSKKGLGGKTLSRNQKKRHSWVQRLALPAFRGLRSSNSPPLFSSCCMVSTNSLRYTWWMSNAKSFRASGPVIFHHMRWMKWKRMNWNTNRSTAIRWRN